MSVVDISYLKTVLPADTDPEFFIYLSNVTAKDVTMHAIDEGLVVFPKIPLITVQGPLPVVQLLETTLLNLVHHSRPACPAAAHLWHMTRVRSC